LLRAITAILEKHGSKLVLEYIKSELNPADELTRGKLLVKEKSERLEQHFREMTELALADLRTHGKERFLLDSSSGSRRAAGQQSTAK
jgi:hypothetical protein